MSYINWGQESPEQLAARRRMEEEYMRLMEQAANVRARAGQAPGVGGGSKKSKVSPYVVTTQQSAIFFFEIIGKPNYQYFFLDYKSDQLIGPIDTGIPVEDYNLGGGSDLYSIDSSGYVFRISKYSDYNDQSILFIDPTGTIIESVDIVTSDLSVTVCESLYILVTDFDAGLMIVFDGNSLRLDSTVLSGVDSFGVGSNSYSAGPFGVCVGTTIGNINSYYSVNTVSSTLIATYDTTVIDVTVNFSPVYDYIAKTTWDPNTNISLSVEILNPNGEVMHLVDLSPFGLTNYQGSINFYGTNKFFVYYDADPSIVRAYQHFGDTNEFRSLTILKEGTTTIDVFRQDYTLYSSENHPVVENLTMCLYNYDSDAGNGYFNTELFKCVSFFGKNPPVTSLLIDGPGKTISAGYSAITANYFMIPIDLGTGVFTVATITQSGVTYTATDVNMSDINSLNGTDLFGNRVLFSIQLSDSGIPAKPLLVMRHLAFSPTGTGPVAKLSTTNDYEINYRNGVLLVRCYEQYNISDPGEIDYRGVYLITENQPGWMTLSSGKSPLTYQRLRRYSEPAFTNKGAIFGYSNGGIYWFSDEIGGYPPYVIGNGGDDMYDGGNVLNTDLSTQIPYTHVRMTEDYSGNPPLSAFEMDSTITDGASYFGPGSTYFTNHYPGLFVMVAKNVSISEFSITGNVGSDSRTIPFKDEFSVTGYSKNYSAFIKKSSDDDDFGNDPSINHIILIDVPLGNTTHTINSAGNQDELNLVTGLSAATEVHYLLMAKHNSHLFTDAEFQSVIKEYLDLVDGLSVSSTLSTLNSQYQKVTSVIPGRFGVTSPCKIITSDGVKNFNFPPLPDYGMIVLSNQLIVGAYYDENNEIEFVVYNTKGEFLHKVTTQKSLLMDIHAVEDRVVVFVETKVLAPEYKIYRTVYMISQNSVKKIDFTSFDTAYRYDLNDAYFND